MLNNCLRDSNSRCLFVCLYLHIYLSLDPSFLPSMPLFKREETLETSLSLVGELAEIPADMSSNLQRDSRHAVIVRCTARVMPSEIERREMQLLHTRQTPREYHVWQKIAYNQVNRPDTERSPMTLPVEHARCSRASGIGSEISCRATGFVSVPSSPDLRLFLISKEPWRLSHPKYPEMRSVHVASSS